MQLLISIDLMGQSLELPIAYHHIVTSLYYRLMGQEEAVLHDVGKKFGKREYRLFTFGPIDGPYQVDRERKRIRFRDRITMEFRAADRNLVQTISNNALTDGVTFGNTTYKEVTCSLSDGKITEQDIRIQMLSPICARKTEEEKTEDGCVRKKEIFLNPSLPEFAQAVADNFRRKYVAAFGVEPEGQISISPVSVSHRDRYVTWYKGHVIDAYKGLYRLQGSADQLTFLYNVGLGEKNSQGFGMFRVVNKK
ncbi:MAG: CRISPR-associated endoribonuclease Cas6 [Lachnospiraceae bacterium]|nr:CRISPR-associated endoribonuclease Cas6 [Lachnospiraceae bacterium]